MPVFPLQRTHQPLPRAQGNLCSLGLVFLPLLFSHEHSLTRSMYGEDGSAEIALFKLGLFFLISSRVSRNQQQCCRWASGSVGLETWPREWQSLVLLPFHVSSYTATADELSLVPKPKNGHRSYLPSLYIFTPRDIF